MLVSPCVFLQAYNTTHLSLCLFKSAFKLFDAHCGGRGGAKGGKKRKERKDERKTTPVPALCFVPDGLFSLHRVRRSTQESEKYGDIQHQIDKKVVHITHKTC